MQYFHLSQEFHFYQYCTVQAREAGRANSGGSKDRFGTDQQQIKLSIERSRQGPRRFKPRARGSEKEPEPSRSPRWSDWYRFQGWLLEWLQHTLAVSFHLPVECSPQVGTRMKSHVSCGQTMNISALATRNIFTEFVNKEVQYVPFTSVTEKFSKRTHRNENGKDGNHWSVVHPLIRPGWSNGSKFGSKFGTWIDYNELQSNLSCCVLKISY